MSKNTCYGNPDVPRMHEVECPDCGATVEIWSDEDETRCKCGRVFSFKQIKKETTA